MFEKDETLKCEPRMPRSSFFWLEWYRCPLVWLVARKREAMMNDDSNAEVDEE